MHKVHLPHLWKLEASLILITYMANFKHHLYIRDLAICASFHPSSHLLRDPMSWTRTCWKGSLKAERSTWCLVSSLAALCCALPSVHALLSHVTSSKHGGTSHSWPLSFCRRAIIDRKVAKGLSTLKLKKRTKSLEKSCADVKRL